MAGHPGGVETRDEQKGGRQVCVRPSPALAQEEAAVVRTTEEAQAGFQRQTPRRRKHMLVLEYDVHTAQVILVLHRFSSSSRG